MASAVCRSVKFRDRESDIPAVDRRDPLEWQLRARQFLAHEGETIFSAVEIDEIGLQSKDDRIRPMYIGRVFDGKAFEIGGSVQTKAASVHDILSEAALFPFARSPAASSSRGRDMKADGKAWCLYRVNIAGLFPKPYGFVSNAYPIAAPSLENSAA
jgi:hypothetical protein